MSRPFVLAAAALATALGSLGALAQDAPAGDALPGGGAAEGGAAAGAPPGGVEGAREGYVITPRAGLRTTFTDNARGETFNRSADVINSPEVGFTASGEGPRLKGSAAYSFAFDKYAVNTDQDGVRHNLLGTGTSELWREHFFVDAQASVSQELISRTGQIAATDRNLDNNQTTVQLYRLSPSLRNNFGNFAQTELRYAIGESISGGSLADATRHEFSAAAKSGPDFTILQWGLSGSHFITDRSNPTSTGFGGASSSTEQSQVDANLQYVLTRELSLLGSVGYQIIDDPTLTTSLDGPTASLGFEYTPGPRTKLRLLGNHRNDSNFASALASYEFRNGSIATFSYDETVTTGQDQLLNNVSALGTNQQGQFVDTRTRGSFEPRGTGLGIGDLSNSTVRRKAATLTYAGAADELTTFNFRARHDESTSESGVSQTEKSDGVLASVTRALGPFTNLIGSVDYTRSSTVAVTPETDDTYLVSLGVGFSLTQTVTVGVDGRTLMRFSNQEGRGLRENSVIVSLRKTF
jgi:uncharacterized protein (PEP-CTERM system associated)